MARRDYVQRQEHYSPPTHQQQPSFFRNLFSTGRILVGQSAVQSNRVPGFPVHLQCLMAFIITSLPTVQWPSRSRNQTNKKLICGSKVGGKWDADKMRQALMLFQNAPRCGGGPSPVENVFGRPIRDGLPAHKRSFTKEWQRPTEELERRVDAAREKNKEFYNTNTRVLGNLASEPKRANHTTTGRVNAKRTRYNTASPPP